MNNLPSQDSFEFSETLSPNEETLAELVGAIVFGQRSDTITLLLVRCNYAQLRERIVSKLLSQLESEELQGPVSVLRLGANDSNLYAQLQQQKKPIPGAVVVIGTESVSSLETLLVEINKRREEFRREFSFPLVLWFSDEGYRMLSKFANDFESIAGGGTLEFVLSHSELSLLLRESVQSVLETLLQHNTQNTFDHELKATTREYLHSNELNSTLLDLKEKDYFLDPNLQASTTFIKGLTIPDSEAIELFKKSAAQWETITDAPDVQLKRGLALFYVGKTYYSIASSFSRNHDYADAITPLEECIHIFGQEDRADLAIQAISQQEQVLHRLEKWDELNTLAKKALSLCQNSYSLNERSQEYGFLAKVALKKQQWEGAAKLAQKALDIQSQSEKLTWRHSFYLKVLAEAKYAVGNIDTAIGHLQKAREQEFTTYPRLYSDLLLLLQQYLKEDKQYLKAFRAKQEQLLVERQYGLLAFVGPRRLTPQPAEKQSTIQSHQEHSGKVSLEISSSRSKDLDQLIARIVGKTHKLIVIHGASGVGKSSLINGGLLPLLRSNISGNRENLPLLIRQYASWQEEIAAQLSSSQLFKPESFFSENAVEESDDARDSSRYILSSLLICEKQKLRPIIIFDQFEEFFFTNSDPSLQRDFFEFIVNCLELQPSTLKIVLSLREDYLHHLLGAKRLMERNYLSDGLMARAQLENILGKDILYEIGNLDSADAKAIIQKLVSRSKIPLENDLIDALVLDLADLSNEIRPIEMQIVGVQLQNNRITTLQDYRRLGERPKEILIQQYLEDVIKDCGEDNHQLVELVLFFLTDEKGTRPIKNRLEIEKDIETLLELPSFSLEHSNDNLNLIFLILSESGIIARIHSVPDDHYQLVHDYLSEVIRQQQAPQLERLMTELESEKYQRQLIEKEKIELVEANRAAREELLTIETEQHDLKEQNKRARLSLIGTVAAAGLGACIAFLSTFIGWRNITLAREATRLEQQGTSVMQKNELNETEALLAAMHATSDLEELTDARGIEDLLDYPTTAPVLGLQTNLSKIRETRLEGHTKPIRDVSFSEEGNIVATASEDGTVRLWNLSGRLIKIIGRRSVSTQRVSFSPNSKIIAIGYEDGVVQLWNTEGKKISSLVGHSDAIIEIKFSKDGLKIATSSKDNSVRLWNIIGEELQIFEVPNEKLRKVLFTSELKHFITISYRDNKDYRSEVVRIVDFRSKKAQIIIDADRGLSFSLKNDRTFISQEKEQELMTVWDIETASKIGTINSVSESVEIETARDSDYIAIFSHGIDDGIIHVKNAKDGQLTNFQTVETLYSVNRIAMSPNGNLIATSNDYGHVGVWNLEGGLVYENKGYRGFTGQLVFDSSGKYLAIGGDDSKIRIIDLKGNQLSSLPDQSIGSESSYSSSGYDIKVTLSPNDESLLVQAGSEAKTLKNLSTGLLFSPVYKNVKLSPNKNIIVGIDKNKTTIGLWNWEGRLLRSVTGAETDYKAGSLVKFDPSERHVSFVGKDGLYYIWQLESGTVIPLPGTLGESLKQVEFSSNGKAIAILSSEDNYESRKGDLRIYDLDGTQIARFVGEEISEFGFAGKEDR